MVKTACIGSGKETSNSYLESIHVAGMCFNSIHLHVHTMGCFAVSSNCAVLVSSFLPENKDEEKEYKWQEIGWVRELCKLSLHDFFFQIKM